jgi:uncharacterized protein YciI
MALFMMQGFDDAGAAEIRKATRPAHLEWINSLGDKVKLGGPMLAEDGVTPVGSVIFLEAESMEEAKAIYAQDPYRDAKLWRRIEIRLFSVVAGGFKT